MAKMENELLTPLKPKFYQRYVDDILKQSKENVKKILSKGLSFTIKTLGFNYVMSKHQKSLEHQEPER